MENNSSEFNFADEMAKMRGKYKNNEELLWVIKSCGIKR
jgi:hypothetical protein